MKKIIIPIIFCVICLSFVFEKKKQDHLIFWNSSIKLKWEDFNGEIDSISEYKALTYSLVEVKPIIVNADTLEYSMTCAFEKNRSWTKDKISTNLLKHEQLHFDITELVVRKMRQKFLSHKHNDLKVSREMVKKIFKEEENERFQINQKYDSETNHGLIADKQKEWESKIALKLKELEKYSSTKVVIKKEKPTVKPQEKK